MDKEKTAKKRPLVSICLITYNHERYIQQAVDSILKQHMDFSYEILIADDASTDQTQQILKDKYGSMENVRLILRKKNSEGKNVYLITQEARGKYIILCEGDDYWIGEDGLQVLVTWLEKHKEYVGVCGRRISLSEKTGFMSKNYDIATKNQCITIKDYLENKVNPDVCAMLFQNFYQDEKYNYRSYLVSREVSDLTTLIYILLHGKIYQLDKIIGVYRFDRYKKSASYNCRTTPRKMLEEHIAILYRLPFLLAINLDLSRKRKVYADWYVSSIQSTYEFLKEFFYLQKQIGIKLTIKCLREWLKGNRK